MSALDRIGRSTRLPLRMVAPVIGIAAVSALLAGCPGGAGSGSLAQQVRAWESSTSFGPGVGALDSDSANVQTLFSTVGKAKELHTLCVIFGDDARTGNGNLPSPDGQLTDELAAAYGDDADAADGCIHGSIGNGTEIARCDADRAKAAVAFEAASSRIQVITGQVPSTTTTSDPGASAGGDPFA